ncbi:MFS transporter [Kineosporia sp. NBRC 101731]|uniref:MFS transporter n=1 Tax=Kineosporia sp. NBRC 101731 TaxID=3032199 RepID=UPI0024A3F2EB|nr:MFS transporter [Kineosporia sp. NBRC 101731]GLY26895.1 MFS transporter [Kineosporia sp. NBRC 101731]
MPGDRTSFLADLMVVLRGANFRKLFSVRLVSQASDGAFQVGLASLVFFSADRATTPTAVAIAAVVTVVPYTLIGPFAGVLLDVWQRRQVLLLANAIRSVMVLAVATMIFILGVGPPVYASALACLSMNRFFLAGLGASLPHVVPRHELVMANAVSPTCGTVATMTGGALGYGVRMLLGAGDSTDATVVTIAALGYATASLLALRMPRTLLGPDQSAPLNLRSIGSLAGDVLRDLRAGGQHIRSRRTVANALGVIGVHRIGYGIMTITVMLLCRNYFSDPNNPDAGVRLLAQVVGALGLGVATAAFVTPMVAARIGAWRWIGACLAISAVVQAFFVADAAIWLLYFGSFVFGATGQSIKICVDSILQGDVDDAFRGRVFGLYDVVFNVALVSAAGLSILLLPQNGYSQMVFMDVALLFTVAGVGYTFREHRQRAQAQNASGGPVNRTPARQRNLD